jgi:Tfp pilus assembly protein PilN
LRALHLNLASRPYRDYRPVYAAVVLISLVTAFLMLSNIDTYLKYVHETRTQRTKIEQLDAQTAQENQRADQLQRQVAGIDFKALNTEVKYVNSQLAERAFSWSELLDRLERVLPKDVRIVTLTPAFDKNGVVHLEMTCVSKTTEGLVDTINALNRDQAFTQPFPHSENSENGVFGFSIGVQYHPEISRLAVIR